METPAAFAKHNPVITIFAKTTIKKNRTTSWNHVGKWYNKLVGKQGHYYHEHVVLPKTLKLLNLQKNSSLLDLGCGQGVLAQRIPPEAYYHGVDSAQFFIRAAQKDDKNPKHHYTGTDVTKPLSIGRKFTHAAIILALQNMEKGEYAIKNAANNLEHSGVLVLVINHPCFRIPRQSSWEIDEKNNTEYRRINRYLSPLKIPIKMEPGKGEQSRLTWSFHFSLSDLSNWLNQNGFVIEKIEEWTSDRKSIGSAAKRENTSRSEFPLFMALKCVKQTR